jgi:thioredoxin 1
MTMAKDKILELNDLNFDSTVLESAGPVLVDFTAAWCAPCRALSPIVERVADAAPEGLIVGSVDADAHPGLAVRYGVRGLPTLIVFAGGKEVGRHLGLTNEAGIRKLLAGAALASPAVGAMVGPRESTWNGSSPSDSQLYRGS